MDQKAIDNPVVKAMAATASAAGAQIMDRSASAGSMFHDLLVLSWPNIAAMAAALYSILLVTEWSWKKIWRPLCESQGWIKPKPRLVFTAREWAEKLAEEESGRVPL